MRRQWLWLCVVLAVWSAAGIARDVHSVLREFSAGQLQTPAWLACVIAKDSEEQAPAAHVIDTIRESEDPVSPLGCFLSLENDYLQSLQKGASTLARLIADVRCLILGGALGLERVTLNAEEATLWDGVSTRAIFFREQDRMQEKRTAKDYTFSDQDPIETEPIEGGDLNAEEWREYVDSLNMKSAAFAVFNVLHVKSEILQKEPFFIAKGANFFAQRVMDLCGSFCDDFVPDGAEVLETRGSLRKWYGIKAQKPDFQSFFASICGGFLSEMQHRRLGVYALYQRDIEEALPIVHQMQAVDDDGTGPSTVYVQEEDAAPQLRRFLWRQHAAQWRLSEATVLQNFLAQVRFPSINWVSNQECWGLDSAQCARVRSELGLLVSNEYGRDLLQRLLVIHDYIRRLPRYQALRGQMSMFDTIVDFLGGGGTAYATCEQGTQAKRIVIELRGAKWEPLYYYAIQRERNKAGEERTVARQSNAVRQVLNTVLFHELGHLYCHSIIGAMQLISGNTIPSFRGTELPPSDFLLRVFNNGDIRADTAADRKNSAHWRCEEIAQILGISCQETDFRGGRPLISVTRLADYFYLRSVGRPPRFEYFIAGTNDNHEDYFSLDNTTLQTLKLLLLRPWDFSIKVDSNEWQIEPSNLRHAWHSPLQVSFANLS